MTIGQKIKELRTELNISVDELADKLGKNRATIYRYEKGDIGNLPLDVLEPLAKALKTTPAYLMGWEDRVDEDEITIGKLIKKMRTQRNMTIDEYAKEIGINPEVLSKYESGEKTIPLDVVNAISEYYRLLTRSYVEKDSNVTITRQERFKEWAENFGHIELTDKEYKKIFEYSKFLLYLRDTE